MENTIERLLKSFTLNFDQNKLDLLDSFLFSLLLEKELLLVKRKNRARVKEIEKVLARYWDYRDLVYQRLAAKNKVRKDQLLEKIYMPPTRLILLLTHSCQLRCKYCQVQKFSGVMREQVLLKAIDLLFTSKRPDLQLQFFGGEPLLRFDLIKKAVAYAEKINRQMKRDLTFVLTTNGILLTKDKLDFLKEHKFVIECSIDGEVKNQLGSRKAADGKNYYRLVLENYGRLFNSGVPHYSISVFMPENVSSMYGNFRYLSGIGFKSLQMNYSLGVFWPEESIKALLCQTSKIGKYAKKEGPGFVNLGALRREPVVLNAELTVDCDGGIYLESGICLEEDFSAMKNKFLVTELKEAENINLYSSTQFQNFYRLSEIYSQGKDEYRKIILNNILLGKRYDAFLRNLQAANG